MMYNVLPSSELLSAILNSPDLLALLSILLLAIVGLAVSLTLWEMAHSLRKHPHWRDETPTASAHRKIGSQAE